MAASRWRPGDAGEESRELADDVFGALSALLECLPDEDVPLPSAADLEAWRVGFYRWLDAVLCQIESFDPGAVSQVRAQGADEWARQVRRRTEALATMRDDELAAATPRRRELIAQALVWLDQQLAFLEAVAAEAGSTELEGGVAPPARADPGAIARIERALDLWINPKREPRRDDTEGES